MAPPQRDPDIASLSGPSSRVLEAAVRMTRPLLWTISPDLVGFENIPSRGPNLFIGNHTMVFMTDYTIMMLELYRLRGIKLWSVGDHFHYKVPLWRRLLLANGAVRGTFENCVRVLERGENLVIFPGGAREVTKRKGEQYQLLWDGRTGFARLAIETGAHVIPFGAVGGDEIFDVVLNGDAILDRPGGRQLDALFGRLGLTVKDYLPPVIKGIGPTLIPRVQRLYYGFGASLDPRPYQDAVAAGGTEADAAILEFRNEIMDAVDAQIQMLFKVRDEDDEATLPARFLKRVRTRFEVPDELESADRAGSLEAKSER